MQAATRQLRTFCPFSCPDLRRPLRPTPPPHRPPSTHTASQSHTPRLRSLHIIYILFTFYLYSILSIEH